MVGVTNKKEDADRVRKLHSVEPKKVGKRFVVGVNREARVMGITTEQYFSRWKDAIRKSTLTAKLKDSVLSNMDFNAYYGLGVIAITIPPQSELSYVGEDLYWREGDSTELAKAAKQIAGIAARFSK